MEEPVRPFRWNLVRRDQLGSLLDGVAEPDLWFLDELAECAAKVLARAGDADLYFVGRSPDSIFDLLSGALAETAWSERVRQLPFSLFGLRGQALAPYEIAQARRYLESAGLAPRSIMRGRPVALVDLVHHGSTFSNIYALLRPWVDQESGVAGGAQWDVVRRRLRFVGITWRTKTSPKTWRWQQHVEWAAQLPSNAIVNVSLPGEVWSYLGNVQPKTAASFWTGRWADRSVAEPRRTEETTAALAEAVALVEAGRSAGVRHQLARLLHDQPQIREPWLRSLAVELRR
jgi:hypothetical protein